MKRFLPILLLASLIPARVGARTSDPAAPQAIPHPVVTAVRLSAPVTVDGLLSEAVWSEAPAFTEFRQRTPVEGAAPSERTEVRIAYDDAALYVGVRCWDAQPDSIVARLTRRDVSVVADRFNFYLDAYHDRRSGHYFMVNAAGVQFDGTLMNDGWDDSSWDGVWAGAAHVDDKGWTCEMRIPYSQFRFNRVERPVWGVNFKRVIARRSEEDYLAYTPADGSGFVSRFGDLQGLEGVRPERAIEVLPYLTTKGEFLQHGAGDPFRSDPRYVPDLGGDVRTNLGGRLTLNATVNPDFGQVEVDPAVVNLSDVESFFEEKRPFFVEGAQYFRFGNEGANDYWSFNWPEPMFFYSRRVGRAPQVDPPDAQFTDVPVGTRILGAAKLTGRLTPSTNFGMLHAVTDRERADLADGATRWDAEVEPLTYYGAAHALRESHDRRVGLGLMSTLVARRFDDRALEDQLNRSSLVVGSDGWAFLDRDKVWVLSGYTAVSRVDGTAARIDALQQSPRHYLQRPDRTHHRLDPDATSLSGLVSRYWLNKQEGNVVFNAAAGYIDPRFDTNDIGFMRRGDIANAHVGTGYQWTKNNAWRRYGNLLGSVFASWNDDGDRTCLAGWASTRATFTNNWEVRLNVDHFAGYLDDRRTRGGPLMRLPAGDEFFLEWESDPKQAVSYALEANGMRQANGTSTLTLEPRAEWKPASNVTLSMGPGYERVVQDAQWVNEQDDAVASDTYGHRYVFAALDQKTLYASVRLNWAFSPRLTLQLYAQPLVSSARFTGFKELARPRSYDFDRYGSVTRDGDLVTVDPGDGGAAFQFREPDFDFKSLRGNAVLRWEYMPGSTLFLVWTQERVDDQPLSPFRVGRSFDRLLNAKADNVLLAKVTYYFNL